MAPLLTADNVLKANAVYCAAWAAPLLAAPEKVLTQISKKGTAVSPDGGRWVGFALGVISANQAVLGTDKNAPKSLKKKLCKVAAAGHALSGGIHAYNGLKGTQEKNQALLAAGTSAIFAAAHAYVGFKKD